MNNIAFVLCAGRGSRLGFGPKILYEVYSQPLHYRYEHYLNNVIYVGGYNYEAVPSPKIYNREWNNRDNIGSLQCALELANNLNEDIYVMDGDLIFDTTLPRRKGTWVLASTEMFNDEDDCTIDTMGEYFFRSGKERNGIYRWCGVAHIDRDDIHKLLDCCRKEYRYWNEAFNELVEMSLVGLEIVNSGFYDIDTVEDLGRIRGLR